jgi:hypothetical protein
MGRKRKRADCAALLLPASRAAFAARGDPGTLVQHACYGALILLLSIVTPARANALPDRLAPVFIVMLE